LKRRIERARARERERERRRKQECCEIRREIEGGGYGCCEIIAYSLNIKAWRSASSYSVDGGRRGGIARRAYLYTYTASYVRVCTRERERKRAKRRKRRREVGGGLREARRERESGRRKGGQVTPLRAALAAGEITVPSLLARDVHKLCITASGAHISALYVREDTVAKL